MSRHRANEVDSGVHYREKVPLGSRPAHQHHQSTTKANSVIDQIKIKVKQKRSSKQQSIDTPDELPQTNRKSASVEDTPSPVHSPLKTTRSLDLRTSIDEPKVGPVEMEFHDDTNVFPDDNGQDSVVPNHDPTLKENVRLRPKPIAIKAFKSLPTSTHNHSNIKKRRQAVRRTGFQIRDEDFQKIFTDLPADERLIIGYSSAWRKDVFMHGRLFLSVRHLCFYTCFFKWEESLCIAYTDIVSVTREKSAKLVPNAIKIRTNKGENFVFASYVPREKIFVAIFRLWQNALLEEPMDYHQLRALVYADQQTPEGSTGDSEESLALESSHEPTQFSQSLPIPIPIPEPRTSIATSVPVRQVASAPPSSDNETMTYRKTCTCETHLAKTCTDRLFTFNVDTLYEFIFGDNPVTREFHESQKLTDYKIGLWNVNSETNRYERLVTYNTITHSILGTNILSCQEKQFIEEKKPHSIYVISTEVHNEGMKYTDAFYVATRFCMTQRDAEHSSLRISAEIRYLKNVNGFIRSFIEKNAYASIENGVNDQVRRLESQQITHVDRSSGVKSSSKSKKSHRKLNRQEHTIEEDSSTTLLTLSELSTTIKDNSFSGRGHLFDIGIFLAFCFLCIHIYLCFKLYSIDQILSPIHKHCLAQCQEACLNSYSRT